jgi:hypothetical protein
MQSGEGEPTSRSNVSPPPSGPKTTPSKKSAGGKEFLWGLGYNRYLSYGTEFDYGEWGDEQKGNTNAVIAFS